MAMLPFINEFLKSMASALCSMLVASIPLSIYFFSRMDGGSVNILLLEALRYVPGIFVAQIFYGFYYYIIGIAVFRLIIKNRKTNTIKHHFYFYGLTGGSIGFLMILIFGILPNILIANHAIRFPFSPIGIWHDQGFPWTDLLAHTLAGATYGFLYSTWVNPPVKTE